MAKLLKYYGVQLHTGYGFGLQLVKANNKIHAKEKFKKRFPKNKVLSIDKMDSPSLLLRSSAI